MGNKTFITAMSLELISARMSDIQEINILNEGAHLLRRYNFILSRIIADLPDSKDWLDPDIEREARELLK